MIHIRDRVLVSMWTKKQCTRQGEEVARGNGREKLFPDKDGFFTKKEKEKMSVRPDLGGHGKGHTVDTGTVVTKVPEAWHDWIDGEMYGAV